MRSWLVLPMLLSCYAAAPEPAPVEEAPPRRAQSYAASKDELVRRMEREMNALMARYSEQLHAIREEFEGALDRILPPVRLLSVERAFRGYGAVDEERYRATIDRLVREAVTATEALVGRERRPGVEAIRGRIEEEAYALAASVAGDARGAGYGFVSGVGEVDERAEVTVDALRGLGDTQALRDRGEIRKGETIELAQAFSHELAQDEIQARAPATAAGLRPAGAGQRPRAGRLLLFQSEFLDDLRMVDQESLVVAIAVASDRLPRDREYRFVQASRARVVRGGVVVEDFGWRLDPTLPRPGMLPLSDEIADPDFLASEPQILGVNEDHPLFRSLRQFTLVVDYATALQNATDGELLGALRWQVVRVVTERGDVAMIPGVEPSFDPDASIVRDVLAAPAAPDHGADAPSDLLRVHRPAQDPPMAIPARTLPGGDRGPIARLVGSDHVRITAGGRRFLAAHRNHLVTQQASFSTVYDGNRGRQVLRLSFLPEDSPLRDLGLRGGDELLSIDGQDIHDFAELWAFLAEHAAARRFDVLILRDGALRRLIYEVEEVPAGAGPDEPQAPSDLEPELTRRLESLMATSRSALSGFEERSGE